MPKTQEELLRQVKTLPVKQKQLALALMRKMIDSNRKPDANQR